MDSGVTEAGSVAEASVEAGVPCDASLGYALQMTDPNPNTVSLSATIANLPQMQQSRTIELWAYFDGTGNTWVDEHGLFEYGNANGPQAPGNTTGKACHEFAVNSWAYQQGQPYMLHPYGNCSPLDDVFEVPADAGLDNGAGWLHVSFGYDMTSNQFLFTINGNSMISNAPQGTGGFNLDPNGNWQAPTGWDSNDTTLYIGMTHDFGQDCCWLGKIDEFRVWNVYRTADQIAQNMRVMLPSNTPGLIAYYKFDEGQGTTVADSTGNASNVVKMMGQAATWVPSDVPGPFTCAP